MKPQKIFRPDAIILPGGIIVKAKRHARLKKKKSPRKVARKIKKRKSSKARTTKRKAANKATKKIRSVSAKKKPANRKGKRKIRSGYGRRLIREKAKLIQPSLRKKTYLDIIHTSLVNLQNHLGGNIVGPFRNADDSIDGALHVPYGLFPLRGIFQRIEQYLKAPTKVWLSIEFLFSVKRMTEKRETLLQKRYDRVGGLFSTTLHFQRVNRKSLRLISAYDVSKWLQKNVELGEKELKYIVVNLHYNRENTRPDRVGKRWHGYQKRKEK